LYIPWETAEPVQQRPEKKREKERVNENGEGYFKDLQILSISKPYKKLYQPLLNEQQCISEVTPFFCFSS
jgi:hypothetical protein